MRHLSTIPICSNTLFCYKLDIKEDLTVKFMNEEFIPRNLVSLNILLQILSIVKPLNIINSLIVHETKDNKTQKSFHTIRS